jgi:uncharacterized protein with HEPN domain
MSARDDRSFLEDMLARIELVEEFTAEGAQAFMASRMMQEAVIRSLEIIGEASRNMSETLRNAHSEVPWRQIAAFRNFVIHVYWSIKLERIWQIVEDDLPPLKAQLKAILLETEEADDGE